MARFARRVREDARSGRLPSGAIAALADDEAVRQARPLADRLRAALDSHRIALESLAEFAGLDAVADTGQSSVADCLSHA